MEVKKFVWRSNEMCFTEVIITYILFNFCQILENFVKGAYKSAQEETQKYLRLHLSQWMNVIIQADPPEKVGRDYLSHLFLIETIWLWFSLTYDSGY